MFIFCICTIDNTEGKWNAGLSRDAEQSGRSPGLLFQ